MGNFSEHTWGSFLSPVSRNPAGLPAGWGAVQADDIRAGLGRGNRHGLPKPPAGAGHDDAPFLHQASLKTGLRFSMKAFMPSSASAVR